MISPLLSSWSTITQLYSFFLRLLCTSNQGICIMLSHTKLVLLLSRRSFCFPTSSTFTVLCSSMWARRYSTKMMQLYTATAVSRCHLAQNVSRLYIEFDASWLLGIAAHERISNEKGWKEWTGTYHPCNSVTNPIGHPILALNAVSWAQYTKSSFCITMAKTKSAVLSLVWKTTLYKLAVEVRIRVRGFGTYAHYRVTNSSTLSLSSDP